MIDGKNRRIGKKINGVLEQGFLYGNQLEPVAKLNGVGTTWQGNLWENCDY